MSGSVRQARPGRGLSVYPTARPGAVCALAHRAEGLGYEHLWFGDSQNLWREAYVTMGAAAVGTSRIVIGTGVTNGVTRHRSVLASAWATLHELTDGRVAAGFGVGDSALRTMGHRPMRVAELGALITDLRTLWRGEEVKDEKGDSPYRIAYVEHPLTVPVYVAASGPRLLDLAGRVADGVILLVGTDPATVRSAVAAVTAGASSAGRSLADIHVVLWAPVAIEDDAVGARDHVRAHVARTVLRPIDLELKPSEQAAVERIRQEYDYYAHMVPGSPHAQLVTDELVRRFALAGTFDECRAQAIALSDAGVDQLAMVPFPGPAPIQALLERFADL